MTNTADTRAQGAKDNDYPIAMKDITECKREFKCMISEEIAQTRVPFAWLN